MAKNKHKKGSGGRKKLTGGVIIFRVETADRKQLHTFMKKKGHKSMSVALRALIRAC